MRLPFTITLTSALLLVACSEQQASLNDRADPSRGRLAMAPAAAKVAGGMAADAVTKLEAAPQRRYLAVGQP